MAVACAGGRAAREGAVGPCMGASRGGHARRHQATVLSLQWNRSRMTQCAQWSLRAGPQRRIGAIGAMPRPRLALPPPQATVLSLQWHRSRITHCGQSGLRALHT